MYRDRFGIPRLRPMTCQCKPRPIERVAANIAAS
jgi:hypothetical protein